MQQNKAGMSHQLMGRKQSKGKCIIKTNLRYILDNGKQV